MSPKKILGGVAAVGAGYFGYTLYKSGGNVKVAEKQVESDYAKAEATIKSELPGRERQMQKQAETIGEKAQVELRRVEDYSKNAGQAAMRKIDEVDHKVEKEAANAKSSISSWFGGK